MTLEDKTLDIEKYKRQRDEFLKKRRKLGKKKHNSVMVLGTGGLGEGTVRRIIDKKYFGSLDISRIYLIGSSLRRTRGIAKDYQDAGHSVIPGDYSSIADWKDICDVIFIATDNHAANKQYKGQKNIPADIREKMTLNNFTLIDNIAGLLNSGQPYNGTILMGTNQVDLLCTYLAQQMDIDPRQIVGLNYIDPLRFRNLLSADIMSHSEQALISPRSITEFIANCFVIGAHKGTMVPVVSNIAYAGISADNITFLKQAVEHIKPIVINRGPEEFEDTGQIASVTPTLAAAEMIEAIITEQKLVTGATFLDFGELIFTDDAAFDIYKNKIPKPIHIGFPIYFKDGKAELLPQWAASEEEREAQLQWFWGLSDADKLAFIESAADIRGEFDGMLDERRVKEPVQRSVYCFTRRVDKEADYPAIDLDTVVFSLDKKNAKKVNMYRPGLSFAPKKSFSCDLGKGISSFSKLCADDMTLSALVRTSGKRGAKESYQVIRWDVETGKPVKYKKTQKDLSSIALCGEDIVCGVNGDSNDVAVIYRKDGSEEVITAGEPMSFSSIAVSGKSIFGISKNKIYQIDGNQLRLIAETKGLLSNPKVVNTDNGSIIAASSANQNTVYVINPAEQDVTSFESKGGIYDISFADNGSIALAVVLRDKAVTSYYETAEDLLDKTSKTSSKSYEIQGIKSLHFDKDFLFIVDSKGKLHLVDNEFPDETYKPVELENAWLQKRNNYAWVRKC